MFVLFNDTVFVSVFVFLLELELLFALELELLFAFELLFVLELVLLVGLVGVGVGSVGRHWNSIPSTVST